MQCASDVPTCSQIRVHLGHVGHPILGDDFYGVMGPWIGRQVWTPISLNLKAHTAHAHEQACGGSTDIIC